MGLIKKFEEWLDGIKLPGEMPQEPAVPTTPQADPFTDGMDGYDVVPPQTANVTDNMNGQGTVPPQADAMNHNMNGYGAVSPQTDVVNEPVQELPGFTRDRVMLEKPQKTEHMGTSEGETPFEFWPDDIKNDDSEDQDAPERYDRDPVNRNLGQVQPAVSVTTPQSKVVISLILDTTLSMKKIYARLYSQMMKELSAIRSLKNIEMSWRLSYICHEGYQFVGEMTTDELEQKLGNVVLCGGSPDGYEEIIDPLREECMALNAVKADVKGLLMLTDTSGKQPVAREGEQQEVCPLDFGILYLYRNDQSDNLDNYIAIKTTDIYHIRTLLYENNLPRLKQRVSEALKHNSIR